MRDKPFKLMAQCIPVKGAFRSTICDLQRNEIEIIPNDLCDLLIQHNGKTIQDIKEIYQHKYDQIIDEYFDFLIEKDFIFFTETPYLFPEFSGKWSEPSTITNALLDIGDETHYDVHNALFQLSFLHVKYLEIRFYKPVKRIEIESLLAYLKEIKSSIISVEILLPFSNEFSPSKNKTLYENYSRLSALKLYDAEYNRFFSPLFNRRGYTIYTRKKIGNELCCGVIDSSLFAINIKTFTESLHFNSCLNRKVSVDKGGYIKNCPSFSNHYGHVDETNLADITNTDDFKKLWNINKDQISICKDCEFRHICTDCRAYRDDPDDIHSKPLKCGYDPYTAEWEDWSMNPLKQKSIKHYGLQEK